MTDLLHESDIYKYWYRIVCLEAAHSVCALFRTLVLKSISLSKMLHFIRDATFHLHWRSFREKVCLIHSYVRSLIRHLLLERSYTLLSQHMLFLPSILHPISVFLVGIYSLSFSPSETLSTPKDVSVGSTIGSDTAWNRRFPLRVALPLQKQRDDREICQPRYARRDLTSCENKKSQHSTLWNT